MPKVYFTKNFVVQYKLLYKNSPKTAAKLEKLTAIFINNLRHPALKTHALAGRLKGKYAFWINWSLRVVFEWLDKNSVRFLILGTHNQVYK